MKKLIKTYNKNGSLQRLVIKRNINIFFRFYMKISELFKNSQVSRHQTQIGVFFKKQFLTLNIISQKLSLIIFILNLLN